MGWTEPTIAWAVTLLDERWRELAGIFVMLGAWRWFTFHGLRKRMDALHEEHRQEIARLKTPPERMPVRAELRNEYSVGFWTDKKDGQRKQVLIPRVWLEYEDGSVKPLEIKQLCDDNNIKLFPLGPISYQEHDGESADEN